MDKWFQWLVSMVYYPMKELLSKPPLLQCGSSIHVQNILFPF